MTPKFLFGIFFAVVLLALLYQFVLILTPYATPLFLACVLAIMLYPITVQVRSRLGGSRSITAIVMTAAVVLLIIIPIGILLVLLVDDAARLRGVAEDALGQKDLRTVLQTRAEALWKPLASRFPHLSHMDISSVALSATKHSVDWIQHGAKIFAGGVISVLVGTSMMLLALFFLFRDGEVMAAKLRHLIPMGDEYKSRIQNQFVDTLAAVVQSSFVIAVAQGIIGGLGYWLIGGLSAAILLGFLTAVSSLIPMIGSALVWVPTVGYLVLTDELARGIGLAAWALLVIGSVDNFVRPLIIGGRVEIPTFLLLFALIGGLQVYGFLGVILAPVVVGVLLAFVQIYDDQLSAATSREK